MTPTAYAVREYQVKHGCVPAQAHQITRATVGMPPAEYDPKVGLPPRLPGESLIDFRKRVESSAFAGVGDAKSSAERDDKFFRGCAVFLILFFAFLLTFPVAILSFDTQGGSNNWAPTIVLWSIAIILIVVVRIGGRRR